MTITLLKRAIAGAGMTSLLLSGTAFASNDTNVSASASTYADWQMDRDNNKIKDMRVHVRTMKKEMKDRLKEDRKNRMRANIETNANIDAPCMKTEITQRETALISALEAYYNSSKAALQKRQASLEAAWSLAVSTDREIAIKAAMKVYAADMESARKTFHDAKATAWKAFRTDTKATCKATTDIDADAEAMDD